MNIANGFNGNCNPTINNGQLQLNCNQNNNDEAILYGQILVTSNYVNFRIQVTMNMINGNDNDSCYIQYSLDNGNTYNNLVGGNGMQLQTTQIFDEITEIISNKPSVIIRIILQGSKDNESCFVDTIKISGVQMNTLLPTKYTINPSMNPTYKLLSKLPTITPTMIPTMTPTNVPSNIPTNIPSMMPTNTPSKLPTNIPSIAPTNIPTKSPSSTPTKLTKEPSINPTNIPSKYPTNKPTHKPTNKPSKSPTIEEKGIIYIRKTHAYIIIIVIIFIGILCCVISKYKKYKSNIIASNENTPNIKTKNDLGIDINKMRSADMRKATLFLLQSINNANINSNGNQTHSTEFNSVKSNSQISGANTPQLNLSVSQFNPIQMYSMQSNNTSPAYVQTNINQFSNFP